ncbi:MAG: FKBP-type peptidyl-prolyl cis-trans isomerase [Promethearchaeota archaeon]
MILRIVPICLIGFILYLSPVNIAAAEIRADWGDTVTVDYVLIVDGEELDSGKLTGVVLGDGFYLSEFELAIVNMTIGETKSIAIPPEGGYPTGHSSGLGDKWMNFDITLVAITVDISNQSDSSPTSELILTSSASESILTSSASESILTSSTSGPISTTSTTPLPPPKVSGWSIIILFTITTLLAIYRIHKREQ